MGKIAAGAALGARNGEFALAQQLAQDLCRGDILGSYHLVREKVHERLPQAVEIEAQQAHGLVHTDHGDVREHAVGAVVYVDILRQGLREVVDDYRNLVVAVAVDDDVALVNAHFLVFLFLGLAHV